LEWGTFGRSPYPPPVHIQHLFEFPAFAGVDPNLSRESNVQSINRPIAKRRVSVAEIKSREGGYQV